MNKPYTLYSSLPRMLEHKTWTEINCDNIRENYSRLSGEISKRGQKTRIISVIKADAYGHGAEVYIKALLKEGCDFFAVSSIDEALAARKICLEQNAEADILILGYTIASQAKLLAENNIITSVFSCDFAEALNKEASAAGVKVRVHVKLDTGMNRIGFPATSDESAKQTVEAISRLFKSDNLSVEGIFTHFSKADEKDSENDALQFERYSSVLSALEERGCRFAVRHVCNSAAFLNHPEYHLDAVRLGIVLYGVNPSDAFDFPLLPVMKLKTVISHIHTLSKGESVSYGGVFTADSERKIATLPIGYADGFLRAYGGAQVYIKTKGGIRRAPIVGRICMDQCMIDITDTDAALGDTVTLFGESPEDLPRLAGIAGTIPYECLCLVSGRVPRIIL